MPRIPLESKASDFRPLPPSISTRLTRRAAWNVHTCRGVRCDLPSRSLGLLNSGISQPRCSLLPELLGRILDDGSTLPCSGSDSMFPVPSCYHGKIRRARNLLYLVRRPRAPNSFTSSLFSKSGAMVSHSSDSQPFRLLFGAICSASRCVCSF
jgi:hypothetical protein